MEGDPEYDEMTDEKIEFWNKSQIGSIQKPLPNDILKAGVKDVEALNRIDRSKRCISCFSEEEIC